MRSSDEIHRIKRSSRKRLTKLARMNRRSEMPPQPAEVPERFPFSQRQSSAPVIPESSNSCAKMVVMCVIRS